MAMQSFIPDKKIDTKKTTQPNSDRSWLKKSLEILSRTRSYSLPIPIFNPATQADAVMLKSILTMLYFFSNHRLFSPVIPHQNNLLILEKLNTLDKIVRQGISPEREFEKTELMINIMVEALQIFQTILKPIDKAHNEEEITIEQKDIAIFNTIFSDCGKTRDHRCEKLIVKQLTDRYKKGSDEALYISRSCLQILINACNNFIYSALVELRHAPEKQTKTNYILPVRAEETFEDYINRCHLSAHCDRKIHEQFARIIPKHSYSHLDTQLFAIIISAIPLYMYNPRLSLHQDTMLSHLYDQLEKVTNKQVLKWWNKS